MAKTINKKILEKQEQIAQLKAQEKQLIQKEKEQSRKARTKRLIERGAILESLIDGAENLTNEQVKTFLEKTVANDYGKRILTNIVTQGGKTTTAEPTATERSNNHTVPQNGGNGARQSG